MRAPYLFPQGARFGADNVILHAKARRHQVNDFAGPLSIKTVLNGAVTWTVAGRDLVVDPNSFLVLGDGEKYSMDLDEPRAVETACAFFRGGFVEEIAQDATTRLEEALDHPARPAPALPYLSRLHADPERSILNRVQTMALRCVCQLQPSGFEEDFLLLSKSLLLRSLRTGEASAGARPGAAVEHAGRAVSEARYRPRVYPQPHRGAGFARGIVESGLFVPLPFSSRVHAGFSKDAAYVSDRGRLARAHSLLRSGMAVAQVCLSVGFSSHSSFSRLFRSHYGLAPSAVKIRKIGSVFRRGPLTAAYENSSALLLLGTIAGAQDLPSQVSMIMLGVENIARSVAFYRDTLGLKLSSQSGIRFLLGRELTLALGTPLGRAVQPRAGATEVIFYGREREGVARALVGAV